MASLPTSFEFYPFLVTTNELPYHYVTHDVSVCYSLRRTPFLWSIQTTSVVRTLTPG